jgi:hypothetical protein
MKADVCWPKSGMSGKERGWLNEDVGRSADDVGKGSKFC